MTELGFKPSLLAYIYLFILLAKLFIKLRAVCQSQEIANSYEKGDLIFFVFSQLVYLLDLKKTGLDETQE